MDRQSDGWMDCDFDLTCVVSVCVRVACASRVGVKLFVLGSLGDTRSNEVEKFFHRRRAVAPVTCVSACQHACCGFRRCVNR